MSRWAGGWAPYVPVAERRRKAARAMEQRRKAGHPVAPVTITGRAIATTFWGKTWCDNIESYRDFESRLPRGRTYVRSGAVVDLRIVPGRVDAIVCGSELYDVTVTVAETPEARWRSICEDCAGGIDSVVELLQGRFSRAVMERLCRQQGGLFPRPSEIRFSCSCPDHAEMCKHVAAVLYGVGARLDHQPELVFRLRAVDETELVTRAGAGLKVATQPPAPGRVLRTDDVAALFGLDMAGGEPGAAGDGAPATADGTERSRRKVSKTATTPMQKAKTAAADPMPRSSADERPRQETPAKAASRPAAARGGSTPGPTAPAVKKAAATRSAARRDTGTSGKAAGAAKVAASGVRSKPRHQRVGHVGGADIPSAPKPCSAADGTAKARTIGTAARKRADTKATKASGGKQRPVRWW